MCGGSGEKKRIENVIQAGGTARAVREKTAFGTALPYYQERVKKGLPFFNELVDYRGGTTARAAAPRRAALIRQMRQGGLSPTDPAYMATMGDFEANLGRGFDDQMVQNLMANEAAKQSAAGILMNYGQAMDPLAYYRLLSEMKMEKGF